MGLCTEGTMRPREPFRSSPAFRRNRIALNRDTPCGMWASRPRLARGSRGRLPHTFPLAWTDLDRERAEALRPVVDQYAPAEQVATQDHSDAEPAQILDRDDRRQGGQLEHDPD